MLDSQTSLILTALLFLVLPAMVWLIGPSQKSREVNMWCLGSLMAGTGLVLLGTQSLWPVVIGRHLSNGLILGYLVCCIQSLRMVLGQAWPVRVWVFWLLMGFLTYAALYEWASSAWRGTLFRFVLGSQGLFAASWSWRVFRRMGSVNAAAIAGAHLTVGLALVVHSYLTGGLFAEPNPFNWNASVISLVIMLTTVVTNLCYVGMLLDLTARESLQAQQVLQASRETELLGAQLRRLDRRGRVAIVSGSLAHELNQPLTAATMNAQLAERQWSRDPVASPMLLELLTQVEAGVDRTVRILQRIRDGNAVVTQPFERVDLQAIVDRTLAQMASEVQRLSVTLTQERSPQPVWCLGDELGLSQVVINLLRNALQAMTGQAQRHLSVACAVQQGQARLEIRDSGEGMATELIERWGEPFLSTRAQGMGLGLAISREIVTRHQGQLLLANRSQGGLEAVVSIPVAEGVST